MEKENFDSVLSIIDGIEKKKKELNDSIQNIDISSRNDILKDIFQDIVKRNPFFLRMGISVENFLALSQVDPLSIQSIIEMTISNMQANPTKKAVYLRVFLNLLDEISDNDKEIMLMSLKDENNEVLKERMESLVKVFNLKL